MDNPREQGAFVEQWSKLHCW